ncbi:topoisomerase DNA-binding C4 zinc finger domain-containing protein [Neobacillus sp. DY30]|uniref:topoisomerase DNA-binding C4 zinc finger domain-containing protein n=1 Tax=Neobacillus sp. DY30 TaxID=3047871 RepID=UPI0024C015AA|nr:topoisomerase DNA-binding C4 zinc finger domain-containing protein [Neobacillus sp. DY30]WHY00283.1 topoisomerase DNA-binding C4 zinc finger domain-containing protein [Neobacillus sp. DY30]
MEPKRGKKSKNRFTVVFYYHQNILLNFQKFRFHNQSLHCLSAQSGKGSVLLVDRDEWIDFILVFNRSIKKEVPVKAIEIETSSRDLTCVKCGSPMVLKTGKRGVFYGCSGFPKCRYTRDSLNAKKEIQPAAESKNI